MDIAKLKRRIRKLYYKLFIYLPIDAVFLVKKVLMPNPQKQTKTILPKTVLLIRHDGIGDYVLFRNFIEVLRKSSKYGDYKITLLGNAAWKELAEFLDKDFVDEFIWLDKEKFTVSFSYRFKKFAELTSKRYDVLIHPFSRDFLNADNDLSFLLNADEKIGSVKNQSYPNVKKWQNKILGKVYTKLISDRKGTMFELYKNRDFFEDLLSEKINIKRPVINLNSNLNSNSNSQSESFHSNASATLASSPYAVFFIGASIKHRKWPAKNFAKTAAHLNSKYGFSIVLCGGKQELADAAKFKDYCTQAGTLRIPFIDTVGKISLVDLLYIVKDASLVVSNETMAPHIAAALSNPPVITISNAEECYGHFVPYPPDISEKYFAVFHPDIEKNMSEYIKRAADYGYKCGYYGDKNKFDISEITPESVIYQIDKILSPS